MATQVASLLRLVLKAADRGAANGVAPLDNTQKLPIANLPTVPLAKLAEPVVTAGDVGGTLPDGSVPLAKLAEPVVATSKSAGGYLDANLQFGIAPGNAPAVNDDAFAAAFAAAAAQGYRGIYLRGSNARYQVSQPVAPPRGSGIQGEHNRRVGGNAETVGVQIHQTDATKAAIILPSDTPGNYQDCQVALRYVATYGGLHGLYAPNGCLGLTLDTFHALYPQVAGLHFDGFTQEIGADWVQVSGGQYGIRFTEQLGSNGSIAGYHDKHRFGHLYLNGQAINGMLWRANFSNLNEIGKLVVVHAGQDGVVIAGGHRSLLIESYGSEKNGFIGDGTYVAATTGTISAGSSDLTVASATGLAAGQTITIAGAGSSGYDLQAVIASSYVSGTTIPLTTDGTTPRTAGTAVTSADVTIAVYDDLSFGVIGAAVPKDITVLNCQLGSTGGSSPYRGQLRYAVNAQINGSGIENLTLGGQIGVRPVYDPRGEVHTIGDRVTLRRGPIALSRMRGQGVTLTPGGTRFMSSPPGGDLVLATRDSVGDGSGTRGGFAWRRMDSNRTALATLGDTAPFTARNSIQLKGAAGIITDAAFDALPPNGTIAYNTVMPGLAVRVGSVWYAIPGNSEGAQTQRVVSGWLADDQQTVTLGVLPADIYIVGVDIYVHEAFNSDGTDNITVGRDSLPAALADSTDCSTTGVKTPAAGTGAKQYSVSTTVKAYYNNGGSEPTTGKALVIVRYVPVPSVIA